MPKWLIDPWTTKNADCFKPLRHRVICYTAIAHWYMREVYDSHIKSGHLEVCIRMLFLKVFWSFWIPHIHLFLDFLGVEALKFCKTGCSWDIFNLAGINLGFARNVVRQLVLSEISCLVSFFKREGKREEKNNEFWMDFIFAGQIWTCSREEPKCKDLWVL